MRRFSIMLVLTGLLGAATAPGAAASGWTIEHTPNPIGAKDVLLNGVACTSKSACTAVGSYYKGTTQVTLAERWNGTKWAIKHTPNAAGAKGSELTGVACTSKGACTAVGDYFNGTKQVTLAERWNGTKWSIQHTRNPGGSASSFLFGVACASKSACIAVGFYYEGTTGVTLAERWNGTKWSIEHTPNAAGANGGGLSGVSCSSARACIAVGSYAEGKKATLTLAERWNGTKWSIQHTRNPTGAKGSFLNGVSCTLRGACTAVGFYDKGTLVERWNGTKWSIQTTPHPAGAKGSELFGVACTSKSACTAVGSYGAGVTLAERWNGAKWYIQHTPKRTVATDSALTGVACTSNSSCTAVGSYKKGTKQVTLAERWNGR